MDDKYLRAVRRLGDRGYRRLTLDMISDELGWTGSSSLESHLDRLVEAGELVRVKRPDCDPEYAAPRAD
jgi:hypothetical protein